MSTILSREQDEENTAKTSMAWGQAGIHRCTWVYGPASQPTGLLVRNLMAPLFQILPATLDKRTSSHWLNDIKRRGGGGARVSK